MRHALVALLLLASASARSPSTPVSRMAAEVGATLDFEEYELEEGPTTGSVLSANRTVGSISSEASGRRAVRLSETGQYVEITAESPANSLVLRFCVPDAIGGGGIDTTLSMYVDGQRTQLNLTSQYSWDYGWDIPYEQNPASGEQPHHFFDEIRVSPGHLTIVEGTVIRFAVDETDTADWYVLDLVDLEMVGEPIPQPSGSLSIMNFGAGNGDDRPAIQSAIDQAAQTGQSVWIPEGTYFVGDAGSLSLPGNVSVQGAGMWYSTLMGNTRFMCTGDNCAYSDFAVVGNVTNRVDGALHGFTGGAGEGTRLTRVWVEHTVCGYWVGPGKTDSLVISGCRFRNLQADGVNLCNGASNSVVEQSHFRNSGDDAIASWSPSFDGGNNTNNTMRHNTAQVPWRANCFAIYGGRDISIEDSLCLDVVTYPGVLIGAEFNSWPFAGRTSVKRTTIVRGGGEFWNTEQGALVIAPKEQDISGVVVTNVTIKDSAFAAIQITGPARLASSTIQQAAVSSYTTYGLEVEPDAQGGLVLDGVTFTPDAAAIGNEAGAAFSIETRSPGR